jgi:predicted RNase H-like nuclease (RuvC/YqgF family)
VPQLEFERQNLHFWNWRRKKRLDLEIEQAEKDRKVASLLFGKTYHVNPDEISRPISQIKKKIAANKLKIADKGGEIAKLEKKLVETKKEYGQYRLEHKIKVRRKLKKQPSHSTELASSTDRQSVRGRLQELRRPREEIQRRIAALEKLKAIKPAKFLMIASPEQKKRSLGDVLGKYYRKVNGHMYPSVPIARVQKL